MDKKLIIFIVVILIAIGSILWYSNQTTIEIEDNTQLPSEGEVENPESEEEQEQEETEEMTVEVYFGNSEMGSDEDCSEVFSVERVIEKTESPARKTVELLIAGPTEEEKEEGYLSGVNSDTEINSLEIEDGTAYIDFSSELEEEIGGSCLVQSITSQIEETLMQFASINNVEISVEGETEAVLQP